MYPQDQRHDMYLTCCSYLYPMRGGARHIYIYIHVYIIACSCHVVHAPAADIAHAHNVAVASHTTRVIHHAGCDGERTRPRYRGWVLEACVGSERHCLRGWRALHQDLLHRSDAGRALWRQLGREVAVAWIRLLARAFASPRRRHGDVDGRTRRGALAEEAAQRAHREHPQGDHSVGAKLRRLRTHGHANACIAPSA